VAQHEAPKFEVPAEFRALAEQSVAQTRKAFDSLFSASQRAVSSLGGQATAAQAGVKDIQRKAAGYTARNIELSFEFAQKLARAKNPEELMQLHADHVKTQIEALNEQARELGRTAAEAVGWSPRP
jgi:phasin